MKLSSCIFISFLISLVSATTHTWYYKTSWVDANPDGCQERKVIGFNGTWPLPNLRVKKGDRVQVYLTNGFDDRNTSLHFHGLFQNGTNQMDGPEMVTQCPIPPGETMLYNFTVPDQAGTYWYHSHTSGQYGDGMRGAFIIEEKNQDDFPYEYDEEVVLTVAEWYHDLTDVLNPKFLSLYNPTGAEPIPQNLLFNETRNATWKVEPNKTYFLRIINVGRFVSQYLYMEDHEFEIIEVDGVMVEKNTTDLLYLTVAQRVGCLVKTKNNTDKNYAFMTKMDDGMLDVIPKDLQLNSTNYIMYDEDKDKPEQYYIDDVDDFFDDFYLKPLSKEELFDEPDNVIEVSVQMNNLGNGINYAFFNNLTYTKPKVPTLVTAMSSGDDANDASVYGSNVNSFVLQKDDIVEIRLNNEDTGRHPFHLHGHVFQLIDRGEGIPEGEGDPVAFDPKNHTDFPSHPLIRDTVYVNAQSYIVMRFKADNPGVWFFHCHIEWHLDQGLAIVLVEAPLEMQKTESQHFTDDFIRSCKKNGMNVTGNAAGNSKDYLDLTGENVQHAPLPAGFTARGIVALVFSCIAAILGLVAITVYGLQDIKDVEKRVARDLDVDITDDNDVEEIHESSSSDAIESNRK